MLKHLAIFATLFTPLAISYHLSAKDNDHWNIGTERFEFNQQHSKNHSVSLKQFTIFNKLGNGTFGSVYLARKLGGPDDGKLYALKTIKIATSYIIAVAGKDILFGEREILEAARESPWVTGLHYAFREGLWLFLVMDLATGGHIENRLNVERPDASTTKRILSELVVAVESLHNAHIHHGDLGYKNILIDNKGHLLLTDFSLSERSSDETDRLWDWKRFRCICLRLCCGIHTEDNCNDIEENLIEFLKNMTDTQLPELKNHPYFSEVDWVKVAEKKAQPPYKPIEIQIGNQVDLIEELGVRFDDEIEINLTKRFKNYSFVAAEHQSSSH